MRLRSPRWRALLLLCLTGAAMLCAQESGSVAARQQAADRRFLLGRGIGPDPAIASGGAAGAVPHAGSNPLSVWRRMASAQTRATALHTQGAAQPFLNGSTTQWQSAGPVQVSTPRYGLITGRISSLAVDPNDASGNTVYLGATGGGVWKSTNAAAGPGSVVFQPETDDLGIFVDPARGPHIPSISIGAITVQPGNPNVLLAGTGDPNDALDSYYGVGILRSVDGGTIWGSGSPPQVITQSKDSAQTGITYGFIGAGFAGFAWSGTTPNLVVAAVSQSLEGTLVNASANTIGAPMAGLYYSNDAGQTWYLSTITDGTNKVIQSSSVRTPPP